MSLGACASANVRLHDPLHLALLHHFQEGPHVVGVPRPTPMIVNAREKRDPDAAPRDARPSLHR